MLSIYEKQLLQSPAARSFPMIQAASAALQRCPTCGGRTIRVESVLNFAVNKYARDPQFLKIIEDIQGLPCRIGGVWLQKPHASEAPAKEPATPPQQPVESPVEEPKPAKKTTRKKKSSK